MSQPWNLGLAEAYRRLGFKSGEIPVVQNPSSPLATVVVGNLSDQTALELQDAHGMVGWKVVAPPGQWSVFQLDARSEGGIVVEAMQLRNLNGDAVLIGIAPVSILTGAAVPLTVVDVGGQASRSAAWTDATVPAIPFPTALYPLLMNESVPLEFDHLYVPPGNSLFVTQQAQEIWGNVVWRELADVRVNG